MEFNLTSFLSLIFETVKDGEPISFGYYILFFVASLIVFGIKDFALVKKHERKENKLAIGSDFILDIVISFVSSIICMYMARHALISGLLGIITACYLTPKLSLRNKFKKNKEEKKDEKSDTSIENTVNVTINNNTEKEEDFLPDFYEPDNLKLPTSVTSLEQLNIVMILEMYGYISPNQKFKMITQSLLETPDEQVDKLLNMFVLEKSELEEARGILNLIKLKNRLVTKDEALHCVAQYRQQQEEKLKKSKKKGE